MADVIILQVPANDANDLERLGAQLGDEEEVEVLHPFDGETIAQLFVLLSGATFPYLRAWVRERIESRKAVVIIHNGTELRGYTADEAERLLASLKDDGSATPSAD
jgi:hypothetical protein